MQWLLNIKLEQYREKSKKGKKQEIQTIMRVNKRFLPASFPAYRRILQTETDVQTDQNNFIQQSETLPNFEQWRNARYWQPMQI